MSEIRIVNPSQLADLVFPGNMPSGTGDSHIRLVLLHPLSTEAMFTSCRTHTPDVMHDEHGRVCGTCSFETLNLEPLTTAWRKAIKEVAPIANIIFDITPPQVPTGREEDKQPQIHWESDPPRCGGFCVPTASVTRVIAAVATATRMRAGGEMSFKIVIDGTQRPADTVMERLGKQLDALATSKEAR